MSFACEKQEVRTQYVLTESSIDQYDIVIYDTNSIIQQFAAEELQTYIKKIFHKKLIINNINYTTSKYHFLLGNGFVKDSLFSIDTISSHATIQCIYKGNIYLAGEEPIIKDLKKYFFSAEEEISFGTLYATYNFLEKKLGVHWFFPTYLGEYLPDNNVVDLKNELSIETPDFYERSFFWKTLYHDKDTIMLWMLRNRLMESSTSLYKHNWYNLVPSGKYFETNPGLFAEVNGKRKRQTSNSKAHGNSAQLCTTNPETVDLVIENIGKTIKSKNSAQYISLSPNDGKGFCECNECKRADALSVQFSKFTEHSYSIHSFYRKVSDSVFKNYPNARLGGYAYKKYASATRNINLDNRFHIRVAINNYGFGNSNCSSYQELENILTSWHGLHPNTGFLSFPYGGYWIYPAVRTGLYRKLVKSLKVNNYRDVRFVFFPEWYNQGLDIWLLSKMLWDAETDIDSVKNIYYNTVYSKSKNTITAFHNYLETNFNEIELCVKDFTMTTNITRQLFKSIFQKDSLFYFKIEIEQYINNPSTDNKEKINLLNFKKIIDLLISEHDAFTLNEIAKVVPNTEKRIEFEKNLEILRKTICITNKSAYFNSIKSPSLYLYNKNESPNFIWN